MAEDERRTKLWMLQIDCLFYFHLQLRHSSSVSGLRWPCQSTALLVFANFFLNILVQRIVNAYFSFSLLCYIRQSKKSLVQGASCHQTMLLCSLPLLRNSVKQLGECMEARGGNGSPPERNSSTSRHCQGHPSKIWLCLQL